jgi:hypothetical protein
MAKYAASLTIPSLTPIETPVNTSISIHEPFISGIEIYFPPGCAGLAWVAIYLNGKLLSPASGSGENYHHGEGPINWIGKIRAVAGESDSILEIRGYNEDDTYPHTPIIRIDTEVI